MLQLGALLSIAVHGGLMLWLLLLLAEPKQFAPTPEQAITVDVVTPEEAKLAEKQPDPQEKSLGTQAATSTPPPPALGGAMAMAQQQQQQPAPSSEFSAFDPSTMALYNMRPATSSGFDARADQAANLKREDIIAFKAQLKKCWRLPNGLAASSSTRVVLRASFSRDGSLQGEPMLVEATASKEGPAIYHAAMQALTQCAPYRSLPRERYGQWKVLDISFSPREMSGG